MKKKDKMEEFFDRIEECTKCGEFDRIRNLLVDDGGLLCDKCARAVKIVDQTLDLAMRIQTIH